MKLYRIIQDVGIAGLFFFMGARFGSKEQQINRVSRNVITHFKDGNPIDAYEIPGENGPDGLSLFWISRDRNGLPHTEHCDVYSR